MRAAILFCCVFMASAVLSFPVFADEDVNDGEKQELDLPWERAAVSVSYFLTEFDSEIRIDSETLGVGTVINFEDSLGLDESINVWRLGAFYRLGRRHRIYFSYYDLSRDATRRIFQEIQVGEKIFQVGDVVQSVFDLTIYRGAYGYSFFQNEHFDISGSIGVFVADTKVGITSSIVGEEVEYLTAPLPVFGLRAQFAFTPKVLLKQNLEFFWITIDNYYGRVIDLNMALEYNPFKFLGLGIGYDVFRFLVKTDDEEFIGSDFLGKFDFRYHGLFLYLKLYY